MTLLFNLSTNTIFSTLASPLATTVGLSFTIFIARVGNKILSLSKVKVWIENLMGQMNLVINDFIKLNPKLIVPIIIFLFWIELVIGFKIHGWWKITLLILLYIVYMGLPLLLRGKHSS